LVGFDEFQAYEYMFAFMSAASVQEHVWVVVVAQNHLGFRVAASAVVSAYFAVYDVPINEDYAPRFMFSPTQRITPPKENRPQILTWNIKVCCNNSIAKLNKSICGCPYTAT
jgi:hypothetical protein